VPATVTPLAALPLTVNGKLDADRLPAPVPPARPVAQAGPPPDDLSAAMAAVWAEVFEVSVTPADNFFALGGNSLTAVRIAALMRDRGLPRVPLRDLYRHPTVAALAGRLSAPPAAGG